MEFDHRVEHTDESMLTLQANLDDMNPELAAYVTERLFAAGANDVWWTPIIMKKGRPGLMLNVLLTEARLAHIEDVIFAETTTLGIRYSRTVCHRLGRSVEKVETPWGKIAVKIGYHNGKMVQFAPEFADCERAAKDFGVPLKMVYDETRRRFAGRIERE